MSLIQYSMNYGYLIKVIHITIIKYGLLKSSFLIEILDIKTSLIYQCKEKDKYNLYNIIDK